MPQASDVIDAQVAAYQNRDLERFHSYSSPGIVIKDLAGNVVMGGLEVMREQKGRLFRDNPDLKVEIQ